MDDKKDIILFSILAIFILGVLWITTHYGEKAQNLKQTQTEIEE